MIDVIEHSTHGMVFLTHNNHAPRGHTTGAERCVEVAAVNPIAVAARAGLACGDVIIEVDGDMQIGRSTR